MSTRDDAVDELAVFQYSSLIEVRKIVTGAEEGYVDENEFSFKLNYTDYEGKEKTEEFTLKDGESKLFVPQYGTSATVTETAFEGYTTSYAINGDYPVSGYKASYKDIDDSGVVFEFFNSLSKQNLVISKTGMKPGESAVFTVKKAGTSTVLYRVILTGTNEGTVSASISNIDSGEYTVEETSWSWGYDPDKASLTQNMAENNIFSFTNTPKETTPLHDEKCKVNKMFDNSRIIPNVKVEDYKKKEDIHIKF